MSEKIEISKADFEKIVTESAMKSGNLMLATVLRHFADILPGSITVSSTSADYQNGVDDAVSSIVRFLREAADGAEQQSQ